MARTADAMPAYLGPWECLDSDEFDSPWQHLAKVDRPSAIAGLPKMTYRRNIPQVRPGLACAFSRLGALQLARSRKPIMASVCPHCQGPCDSMGKCPVCDSGRGTLTELSSSGRVEGWQQTPGGRILVGVLVAV